MMRNSYDPAPSKEDHDLYKIWHFSREYPNIPPNMLFSGMAKSLQEMPFFKVWKVDNDARYIDMTTDSLRLNADVRNQQVQAEMIVLEGKDPSSSVIHIRIMPTLIGIFSLYDIFVNIDADHKFAEYVANLIFGRIEAGYHDQFRGGT
jgi:hypothetical protein